MSNLVNRFYPRKLSEQSLKRKIMREAYMEGFSAKKIAEYFGMGMVVVYETLNIKYLKVKIKEKRLTGNGE